MLPQVQCGASSSVSWQNGPAVNLQASGHAMKGCQDGQMIQQALNAVAFYMSHNILCLLLLICSPGSLFVCV